MCKRSNASGGFTLLEMLFVLVVVGLLVGLTMPRFAAGLEQRELLAQRKMIEDQLRELPHRVRLNARPMQLPLDFNQADMGDGLPPLQLPKGWTITFMPPLEISILGTCSPSLASVSKSDSSNMDAAYRLEAITCELKPLPN